MKKTTCLLNKLRVILIFRDQRHEAGPAKGTEKKYPGSHEENHNRMVTQKLGKESFIWKRY